MTTSLLTVLASLALAAPPRDTLLDRAESLLVAHQLDAARDILDPIVAREPHNIRAEILLGRVYLAWPTIGRFAAWRCFELAARTTPDDPEPRYYQAEVGEYLGGDDGEAMARDALIRVFAIAPDYRDSWTRWRQLYRDDGDRRRAIVALDHHRGVPVADLRRAELLIEMDSLAASDAVLGELIEAGHGGAGALALRAQGRFEAGDEARGLADYAAAIAHAADDTAGYLWYQIRGIATPEEATAWSATAPAQRSAFLDGFWTRRDPDLFAAGNRRIAEHFARWRAARRDYHMLHPLGTFHRSAEWRAFSQFNAAAVLEQVREFGLPDGVVPGRSALADSTQAAGLGVSARDVPEPDSTTRYRELGLDGRGLLYLRYGAPLHRQIASGGDVESWTYLVDGRQVAITFAHSTGAFGWGGDMVLFPTGPRELRNSVALLASDHSTIPDGLPVAFWVATFRGKDGAHTATYVRSTPDSTAAALWDASWRVAARATGSGPVLLTVPGGDYALGVDARARGALGGARGRVVIPSYSRGVFALSSLIVAPSADTAATREEVLQGMGGDLRMSGPAFEVYAEVYDAPTRDGLSEYDVEYRFERLDRADVRSFSFNRRGPAASAIVERLVVRRDQVPAGRYRLSLTIRDRVHGNAVTTTRTELELR